MTTRLLDPRRVTTPNRLRLPAEIVDALAARAGVEGLPVEQVAARLLVGALPELVSERTAQWLGTMLSLAYPVDVPAAVRCRLDDGTVTVSAADPRSDDDPGPEPGVASEVLTTSPTASVAGPAPKPGVTRRARPSAG